MTIAQMHVAIDIQLQRIASHVYGQVLPQEKDIYLNRTIAEYVRAKQNILRDQEGNDPIIKNAHEDLRTVLKTVLVTPVADSSVHTGAKEITISSGIADFYLYISSRSRTGADPSIVWKNNRLVGAKEFHEYATTGTNIPYFRQFPALLEGDKLAVLRNQDSGVIDAILVTYAKKPATVFFDTVGSAHVNCDLPVHTHEEIVEATVSMMLTDLNSKVMTARPNDQS